MQKTSPIIVRIPCQILHLYDTYLAVRLRTVVTLQTHCGSFICLTLWVDAHCCHMGTAVKHPVPDRIKPSFVIFWHPGTLTLMTERQSARMSKITNDGLTRSGTGCFIAVPIRQQWASKGKDGLSSQIWQRKVKCGHQQQQNRRTHKLTHRDCQKIIK